MKRFKSGGMAFYMLGPGEFYPDPYSDKDYIGAYVVFPYEGEWLAQIHKNGGWVDITGRRFETENAAFNAAYDHYLAEEKKVYSPPR